MNQISSEIRGLQTHSMSLNQKLKNRRALEVHLASVVDQMVIPPDLIRRIFEEDVDEKYEAHLSVALSLLSFSKTVPFLGLPPPFFYLRLPFLDLPLPFCCPSLTFYRLFTACRYMEDLANLRLKLTFFAAGVPTESRAYVSTHQRGPFSACLCLSLRFHNSTAWFFLSPFVVFPRCGLR